MKTIFKYPVPINDEFKLMLPIHHKILTFRCLRSQFYIWALVESDSPAAEFTFGVYGTGHPIGWFKEYIGTAPDTNENFVWHLFAL
jgi:hypothetical protein